jgi:hypothetical protein
MIRSVSLYEVYLNGILIRCSILRERFGLEVVVAKVLLRRGRGSCCLIG